MIVRPLFGRRASLVAGACDRFCDTYAGKTWSPKMDADYRRLMSMVARKHFGLRGDVDRLINESCRGNWRHFWETESETAHPTGEIVRMLLAEIRLCGDQWTWDRFIRVNWHYQRILCRERGHQYCQEVI